MIQNIKGLLKVKEEIGEVSKKLEVNQTAVDDLTKQVSLFRQELEAARESQANLIASMNDQLQGLGDFKKGLDEELYEFKLLKNELQRKVLQKFEEELNKELKEQLKSLGEQAESFDELKQKIGSTAQRTELLSKEMDKFTEISKNIKARDFELDKFANQLLSMDKEKLELMKKIDTLERMLAAMQRRR